jgi:gliding motility-associated-like protein
MKTFVAIVIFIGWIPLYAQIQIIGGTFNDHSTILADGNGFSNTHDFRAKYYLRTQDIALMPQTLRATIYRKRDKSVVNQLTLTQIPIQGTDVYSFSRSCGNIYDTIQQVSYKLIYDFDEQYNDPNGYYITTEPICCRQNSDNLSRNNIPFVQYLELGPYNKVPIEIGALHTPIFAIPSVVNACAGQLMSIVVQPASSIKLGTKLSLSSPLTINGTALDSALWKNNHSPNNFSNSLNPLRLNPDIGLIIGRPDKVGSFTYVVKAEATIGGVKYSETRQEFRLIVRECKVLPKPVLTVSKVNQPRQLVSPSVCQDSSIQLNLRNVTKNTLSIIQWYLNGKPLANASDSIWVVKNNQGGTYVAVNVDQTNGCTGIATSDTMDITFLPKPSASITTASQIACQPPPIQLVANTTSLNTTFQWFKNDVAISGATMGTLSATDNGTYSVKVTSQAGCSNLSQPTNVATTTPPKAEITTSSTALCQGQSIILSANTGTGHTYQWRRDGQPIAGATSATYTTTQIGGYTVVVSASVGCSTTSQGVTINLSPNPTINITTPNTQLCPNNSTTLTATGQNLNNYQWLFNGQPIAGATMATYTTNQIGAYTVKANDPNGCTGTSSASNIVTAPVLPVSINATNTQVCEGGSLLLTANGPNLSTYQWLLDGQPIVGATMATYNATKTGAYTVRANNASGCTGTSTATTVGAAPALPVSITAPSTQVCEGGSLLLTANGSSLSNYQWLLDGQPITGATMATYNATKTGAYTVRANNTSGCTGTSTAATVGAAPALPVTITSSNTQVCEGGSLLLTANGPNLSTYQWLLDGQPIAGATMATHNATQAGNYTLRAANAASCSGVSPITAIKTIAKIRVAIDAVPNFCGTAHNIVTLRATPAGGLFGGNGVVGNTFDPKIAGIGQHTVTYTIMGALECLSGNAQQTITISAPPILDLGPDVTINTGGSVRLNGTIGPGYAYFWSPQGSLDNPTIATPLASPTATTTYRLRATNSSGCVVEDTIRIRVIQQIFVPTGFSPNGDGINDTWVLRGIESYADTEVRIYNRWGHLVFYSKNYPIPFDGTYNGSPLPAGVYIYTISTGSGPSLRGSFMLIR